MRARHTAERTRQVETHREERRFVSEAYRQARTQAKDALMAETSARIAKIEERRAAHLAVLEEQHRQAEDFGELRRQQREAEREQDREKTEERIRDWKKTRAQERGGAPDTPEHFDKAVGAGQPTARSEAIRRAIEKTQKKQEEEKNRGPGKGFGRKR